ncbi:MAG: tetratricopeptide repeat protein [candidate division Zixibacteria bacterium]|nr:tetratricopeptide repeat protein [candidate division Zixibacteria bacterium]
MKKRSTLLIIVLLFILSLSAFAQDAQEVTKAPYLEDFEKAKELAAAGDKPIIIDFYTDWCSWCKKFDKEQMTTAQAIDYFTNEVVMVKVNAEVDTVLAREYGVIGYPTFVLTSSSGDEIDRTSYLPIDEFIKTMSDYQKGIGTLQAVLDDANKSEDRALYFELADKYKYRNDSENANLWFGKIIANAEKDSLSGEASLSMADLLRRQDKDDDAMAAYKQIIVDYAGTQFEGRGMMYVGHSHRRVKEFDNAIAAYNSIMEKYEGLKFAEEAEIYIAIAYRDKGDTALAITAYANFVKNWPESEDVGYANKQVRKLRGE